MNQLAHDKKVDALERFLAGQSYRTIQKYTGVHPGTMGQLIITAGMTCRTLIFGLLDQLKKNTRC